MSPQAEPEVIRAAYRSLAALYHPDRPGAGSLGAEQMAEINQAYATLSDPAKRASYDQRLKGRDPQRGARTSTHQTSSQPTQPTPRPAAPKSGASQGAAAARSLAGCAMPIVVIFIIGAAFDFLMPPRDDSVAFPTRPPVSTPSIPQEELWQRPATAPNGSPWPQSAGYLTGVRQLGNSGLSSVSIDNTRDGFDVHVKLVRLSESTEQVVREIYIPAGQRFTARRITAGRYYIRYRALDDGSATRSEAFSLEEVPTSTGTEYSVMEITLYRVPGGNMDTRRIPSSEF